MESIFSQLSDQAWFVDADRDAVERLLAAPVVPNESVVVRPCASRKAVAISYKAQRGQRDQFEIVHTRVRLDAQRQLWSVDNTTRSFPTIAKLVGSLRLKPLAKPFPVAVRVDVEPLKRFGESVFVDTKWTVRDLLDHVVAHRWPELARDAIALHTDHALLESALLASVLASPSLVLTIKGAAPLSANHYDQLPPLTGSKPIYDIIPDLNSAIDREKKDEARKRPQLPVKDVPPVAAAAAAADEPPRESMSGAFFDNLLSDLSALEADAALQRDSGFVDSLKAEMQIDTQKIQSKKLNTLFDLIDEEEEENKK